MYCFKKLKENSAFRRIYGRGVSFVHPAFVTYALKNHSGDIRVGLTVSKKLGGAVERNRAKRVLTAAFSQCAPLVKVGCDFVFVARTRIFRCKSTLIAAQMLEDLNQAGLLEENE